MKSVQLYFHAHNGIDFAGVSVAQPGGSVTHHIPIRQVSQSPAPQSAASEIQLSCQPNVPASEQKVQEPKKYMGSNIPSRSFKMLQAMTTEDGQPGKSI